MAKEIERRWLLTEFPQDTLTLSPDRMRRIEQGYLERSSPLQSLRVRIIDGTEAVVTGKEGSGMERDETEESVSLKAAEMFMRFCDHKLSKTRYNFGAWEVDFFHGPLSGIVLAEMEGTRDAVLVAEPEAWMGPAVEVTDSLTNLHLARMASDMTAGGSDSLAALMTRIGMPHLPKVVITGGPGSGKSTMLELLRGWYPQLHFVPEVATIVIAQVGIVPSKDHASMRRFQKTVWRIQKVFERASAEAATLSGKKGMVMDRGSMDNAAYLPGGAPELMAMFKTDEPHENSLYDLVLDLAVPPRDIYERIVTNNPARTESFEEAVALGNRISNAWSRHPRHVAIGNHDGWDGKVAAVRRELDKLLK